MNGKLTLLIVHRLKCVLLFISIICTQKTVSQSEGGSVDDILDVYICAGQSNMVGNRSELRHLPKNLKGHIKNVFIFDNNSWVELNSMNFEDGFGPEISFAYELQKTLNKPIGIIKHAVGGQSLAIQWNSEIPGRQYELLKTKVDSASVKRNILVKGFLWMQGERDSRNKKMALEYAQNLENLIKRVRIDFDNPKMSFVLGRVNPPYPFSQIVRNAQENCQISQYTYVNCDNLSKHSDELHYNTEGLVELGRRFALGILKLEEEYNQKGGK